MADHRPSLPYELAYSKGIDMSKFMGLTPFGGKPAPQKLPKMTQIAAPRLDTAYQDYQTQIKNLMTLYGPQEVLRFTITGTLNKQINDNNGGNGNSMAYKAKVGDRIVLVKHNGGNVRVGDKGVITDVGVGDGYVANFPAQSQYTMNPSHFELDNEPELPKVKVDFDTVVIADHKREQILEALEQINQQKLIFETWGFGETIEKGRGVSMLFYGPPGTGKTLMAQAIANKHDMKLKIIATADVESSSPGEAERNIRQHFADATREKSIMLFDECDSLIYTRQNVGPIMGAQVNELLSQIERFEGITIFTTNRLGTLDEAVNRRLALKLEFDMPDREQRAEIWQRMFPIKAPLDEAVDWLRLAIVEITGGYIKNCVLRAARMAAAEKIPDKEKKITMAHLVKSAKLETESMMEFENARQKEAGTMGHVVHHSIGQETGRTIQKVQATKSMIEGEDDD